MKTKYPLTTIAAAVSAMTFTPVIALADPGIISVTGQLSDLFFTTLKSVGVLGFSLLGLNLIFRLYKSHSYYGPAPTKSITSTNRPISPAVITNQAKSPSNDFLSKYKKVDTAYKQIQAQHTSIQESGMSPLQKERANRLVALAERTIDNMRLLDRVGDVGLVDLEKITGKLASVDDGLTNLIDTYKKYLAGEFDNIEIPDNYSKQDELEELRIKGVSLLSEIKDDSDFNNSEDRFRLNKIVNEQLDDLWANYTSAKASYRKEISSSPFGVKSSTKHDPDDILDIVFASIRSTYRDIENGVKSAKQELAMTKLLTTKNYFESR